MTTEKVISAGVQFFTISDDESGQRLDNFLLQNSKACQKA